MLDQPISQASQSYERLPVLVVKGEIDLAVAPSLATRPD